MSHSMMAFALQAAQESRLLLLDRQARGMRAQIAAMKEGRILSTNTAFLPSDRYPRLCGSIIMVLTSRRILLTVPERPLPQLSYMHNLCV